MILKTAEVIRKFLTENNLEFIEDHEGFHLEKLRITIPRDTKDIQLSQDGWKMLSLEIGAKIVGNFMREIEKCEGAKIYEFRKKEAQ